MSTRVASFKTSQIVAVNITIQDENGAELETIDENQRHLAFLLLFISFLYADNCKLFFIDVLFQNLFDSGIIGMMDLFKKHFPAMQFIILNDTS
uniref:Uncharacterized protein n=1 Tax=Anopheles atroparvus TaxID=41427 RepID=A0AAG5CXS0_ANOAO